MRAGRGVTILAGMITLVFLGIYAAALNAGSKALHVLFDWDYQVGAVMGALIVLLLCGRIRVHLDGCCPIGRDVRRDDHPVPHRSTSAAVSTKCGTLLDRRQPSSIATRKLPQGLLFMLGWLVAGIGVVGQPHIMVRAMAVVARVCLRRAGCM